eukprot:GHVU01085744.1.p1 GENE.GHVU01085744.1~~GHVU01085744.1.p1  ORF type:complete len:124 (-),score=19.14 GHVU01085744.1:544-915(-)
MAAGGKTLRLVLLLLLLLLLPHQLFASTTIIKYPIAARFIRTGVATSAAPAGGGGMDRVRKDRWGPPAHRTFRCHPQVAQIAAAAWRASRRVDADARCGRRLETDLTTAPRLGPTTAATAAGC